MHVHEARSCLARSGTVVRDAHDALSARCCTASHDALSDLPRSGTAEPDAHDTLSGLAPRGTAVLDAREAQNALCGTATLDAHNAPCEEAEHAGGER